MEDYEYDENDEYNNYDMFVDNWKIEMGGVVIDTYHTKIDAVIEIFGELESINNDIGVVKYTEYVDFDDMVYDVVNMDYDGYYDFIVALLDRLGLDLEIKLI